MPLYRRSQVPLAPLPPENQIHQASQVFQIRFTGEIFLNYEKRIWTCELTGKSNLTYEEALKSERSSKALVDSLFPDALKKAILEFIEWKTGKLDTLAGECYNMLATQAFPGEVCNAEIPGFTQLREVKVVDWNPKRKIVTVTDPKTGLSHDIAVTKIKRNRTILSKKNIGAVIKECTTRDHYNGAPFVLKPEIRGQYGIETTQPPQEIKELMDKRQGHDVPIKYVASDEPLTLIGQRSKEIPKAYPIEDLDLVQLVKKHGLDHIVRSGRPVGETTNVNQPKPQRYFAHVPSDCLDEYLQVYTFLITFSKHLNLYPMTFDDFCLALTDVDPRQNNVMAEIMTSLLWVSRQERQGLEQVFRGSGQASVIPEQVVEKCKGHSLVNQWKNFPWCSGKPVKNLTSPACGRLQGWAFATLGALLEMGKYILDSNDDILPVMITVLEKLSGLDKEKTLDESEVGKEFETSRDKKWKAEIEKRWNERELEPEDEPKKPRGRPAGFKPKKKKKKVEYESEEESDEEDELEEDELEEDELEEEEEEELEEEEKVPSESSSDEADDPQDEDVVMDENAQEEEDDDLEPLEESEDELEEEEVVRPSRSSTRKRKVTSSSEEEFHDGISGRLRKKETKKPKFDLNRAALGLRARVPVRGETESRSSSRQDVREVSIESFESVSTPSYQNLSRGRPKQLNVVEAYVQEFGEENLMETSLEGWQLLTRRDRLQVLQFFINFIVINSEMMREVLDQYEKRRLEVKKQLDQVIKQEKELESMMKGWEKGCWKEDQAAGVALEPRLYRPGQPIQEPIHEESESETENKPTGSTSRALEMHQKKLDAQEKQRQVLAKQREANLEQRREKRQEFEDRAQSLFVEKLELERQLRGWHCTQRLKPLGRDRFFNRYYWYDACLGGEYVNECQEWGRGTISTKGAWHTDKCVAPFRGRPTKALMEQLKGRFGGPASEITVDSLVPVRMYGTGTLIVEFVGLENKNVDDIDAQQQFVKPAVYWGYYDYHGLKDLFHWLNPKGSREFGLYQQLEKVRDEMSAMMKKRQQEYEEEETFLGPFGYVNRWHRPDE